MAWLPWVLMICGGAGTRLGSRRSVSVTHEWMGLGSSFKAPKRPSSSALLLGWLLFFIPPVSSLPVPHVRTPSRGARVAQTALCLRLLCTHDAKLLRLCCVFAAPFSHNWRNSVLVHLHLHSVIVIVFWRRLLALLALPCSGCSEHTDDPRSNSRAASSTSCQISNRTRQTTEPQLWPRTGCARSEVPDNGTHRQRPRQPTHKIVTGAARGGERNARGAADAAPTKMPPPLLMLDLDKCMHFHARRTHCHSTETRGPRSV